MKPITDTLREIRGGKAVDQATRLLAELVLAVAETGKPGELVLTLKVKPDKGAGNAVEVAAVCKVKKPLEDLPKAVFFIDAAGDLHRSDPAQKEINFADAGAAATRQ